LLSRRFIIDLFDKLIWSQSALDKVDEMSGLKLTYSPFDTREQTTWEGSVVSNKPKLIKKIKGSAVLPPSKVVKGFE
jgi:hypothetical protein